mgnify:CR=1 FL=1
MTKKEYNKWNKIKKNFGLTARVDVLQNDINIQRKDQIVMLEKLEDVLSSIEYGLSELHSAGDNLPDYDNNQSSKSYMDNSESYLEDAVYELEKVVDKLRGLEWKMQQQ